MFQTQQKNIQQRLSKRALYQRAHVAWSAAQALSVESALPFVHAGDGGAGRLMKPGLAAA
jgi:hypothetical protein